MKEYTGTFTSHDGITLFRRTWLPGERPLAHLVFIHGAFEHSGRYDYALSQFASRGIAVYSFDLRGHGKSGGRITAHSPLSDQMRDIEGLLGIVRGEVQDGPLFLAGQSLGGALAVMYCVEKGIAGLRGVILCAPALKLVIHPVSLLAGIAIGKLLPHYAMNGVSARLISRDKAVVHAYEFDPLVNRQGIPIKTLSDFTRGMSQACAKFCSLQVPFLVLHGTQDRVADIRGSRELFERSASPDKSFIEEKDFFHDILNDLGREKVYEDIISWIKERSR